MKFGQNLTIMSRKRGYFAELSMEVNMRNIASKFLCDMIRISSFIVAARQLADRRPLKYMV